MKELTMRNGEVVDAADCPNCDSTLAVFVPDAADKCPVCGTAIDVEDTDA